MEQSIQNALTLGPCNDGYYYSSENSHKNCWATQTTTKFLQSFTNLTSGVNQFIFNPAQGFLDLVLSAKLPEAVAGSGAGSYTGVAFNRSWFAGMISQVSFRVSGSAQYFQSGGQQLLQNLVQAEDQPCKDFLFALGGSELGTSATPTADYAGDALFAYVYVNLPWCRPTGGASKPLPLPTDCVTQPVLVTIELRPLSAVASTSTAGTPVVPASLDRASFQVKQVSFMNRGDMLAIRHKLDDEAYSYPIRFYQQEYQQNVTSVLNDPNALQTINLTGFRQGEVRRIWIWLTLPTDTASSSATKNVWNWYLPRNLQLTLNGEIIHRSDAGASLIWDLVSGVAPPKFSNSLITQDGAGAFSSSAMDSYFVGMPFSQQDIVRAGMDVQVNGTQINNSIVTLQLSVPTGTGGAVASYVLHACYEYNAKLLFSRGDCQYQF